MTGFRGTNPKRHPWFDQDIPEPELPPECNVVWASPEPPEEVEDGDVEDDS